MRCCSPRLSVCAQSSSASRPPTLSASPARQRLGQPMMRRKIVRFRSGSGQREDLAARSRNVVNVGRIVANAAVGMQSWLEVGSLAAHHPEPRGRKQPGSPASACSLARERVAAGGAGSFVARAAPPPRRTSARSSSSSVSLGPASSPFATARSPTSPASCAHSQHDPLTEGR